MSMKATLLVQERTVLRDDAFFEVIVWQVPSPVPGSYHQFKYRLALVVQGECVLRYDNERGKGDHRHVGGHEEKIEFTTLDKLLTAFQHDMERVLR